MKKNFNYYVLSIKILLYLCAIIYNQTNSTMKVLVELAANSNFLLPFISDFDAAIADLFESYATPEALLPYGEKYALSLDGHTQTTGEYGDIEHTATIKIECDGLEIYTQLIGFIVGNFCSEQMSEYNNYGGCDILSVVTLPNE